MPDVSVDHQAAVAPLTTLRLGGPAERLRVASDAAEIVQMVRDVSGPLLILAGGSNVVVGDAGVPGDVLLVRSRGASVVATDADADTVTVRVAAGEPWDGFVADAGASGWSGVECLAGIPGSAGATPIQNVGAYGQEVAETIVAVTAYDRLTEAEVVLGPAECGFAYRHSVFKYNDRWVVLSVDFRLPVSPLSSPVRYAELARALGVEVGARVPLADASAAVRSLRAGKGMVLDPADHDTWSVGSFFMNPVLDGPAFAAVRARAAAAGLGEPSAWPGTDGLVKVSAAWLIERAGFAKGHPGRGGVAISGKHTLALTNRGGGTTSALLDLAREIRAGVHDRFGVTLHPEPVLVNCSL